MNAKWFECSTIMRKNCNESVTKKPFAVIRQRIQRDKLASFMKYADDCVPVICVTTNPSGSIEKMYRSDSGKVNFDTSRGFHYRYDEFFKQEFFVRSNNQIPQLFRLRRSEHTIPSWSSDLDELCAGDCVKAISRAKKYAVSKGTKKLANQCLFLINVLLETNYMLKGTVFSFSNEMWLSKTIFPRIDKLIQGKKRKIDLVKLVKTLTNAVRVCVPFTRVCYANSVNLIGWDELKPCDNSHPTTGNIKSISI